VNRKATEGEGVTALFLDVEDIAVSFSFASISSRLLAVRLVLYRRAALPTWEV
jgi:hypothetical protein